MKKALLVTSLLLFAISACNAVSSQTETTQSYPNESYPNPLQPQQSPPLTEADVPRITPADAKSAFDSGQAVIVDVRAAESYAEAHIAGALSIPLDGIEINPSGVSLDKNQWIITYCT